MSTQKPRLALTLSGGGFRATLFHLGVVRFLFEVGKLTAVKRIGAVSVGSILAAHLALNWEGYTGNNEAFDSTAEKIITFARSDLRGRIVRRWILAWLAIVPRLLRPGFWTLTNLLQRFYAEIYGKAQLKDLLPTAGINRPQTFFYCTSLSTGSVCSFGRSGFMWDDKNTERSIVAPSIPVSFAVAASSAFPPLFPPIAISKEFLSTDLKDFSNTIYLTDGGVYDNLGIDRLLWYHKQTPDVDTFVVSDAEGNFDWDLDNKYKLVTSRNIRASNLLMKRVSSLQYEALAPAAHMVVVDIDLEVQKPGDPAVLGPGEQRHLRNVRTDLDSFSPTEVRYLIWHGYTVARERFIQQGLVPPTTPSYSWEPLPKEPKVSTEKAEQEIRRSRERKLRLFSFRDWASWASLLVVASIFASIVVPVSMRQRQLLKQAATADDLHSVNQKLNTLAVGYYTGRHRPITPGTSAAHFNAPAGTICCIVRSRGGGGQRYLLSANNVFAPPGFKLGDLSLQPGPLDGGREPGDAVARLSRVLLPNASSTAAIGALAEVLPGIDISQSISGIGPIRGIAENLSGQEKVFIVGRTTGISDAFVSDIHHNGLVNDPHNRPILFNGLIGLRTAVREQAPARGGDSGAPVLTADGRLAGMVIAGSAGQTLVIPIRSIFDALDVELDLPTSR